MGHKHNQLSAKTHIKHLLFIKYLNTVWTDKLQSNVRRRGEERKGKKRKRKEWSGKEIKKGERGRKGKIRNGKKMERQYK